MTLATYQVFKNAMLSGTDAWKEFVTDDVVLTGPLGHFEGKDQFIQANNAYFAAMIAARDVQVVEQGEWVIARTEVDVNTSSGQVVTLEVSEWYQVQDGLIKYLRTYFDPREFLSAMASD